MVAGFPEMIESEEILVAEAGFEPTTLVLREHLNTRGPLILFDLTGNEASGVLSQIFPAIQME